MENAGKSSYHIIIDKIIPSIEKFNENILVFCGPGNNGGDGLVIAKYLQEKNYKVDIFFPLSEHKIKDELHVIKNYKDLRINNYSIIVDSIFGVGFNRKFSQKIIALVKKINKSKALKISIDIASGIDADSGNLLPISVKADHTITFAAPKLGHYLLPGKSNSGKIHVVSIGEKKSEIQKASKETKVKLNTPNFWIKNFKWPTMIDHKYSRGHVLVKSGPLTATGASRLSAISALRSGAGAVTLSSDTNALVVNASHLTSVMLKEINNADELSTFMEEKKIDTVIIGPGSGVNKLTKDMIIRTIKEEKSLVLDADGLTSFEKNPEELFFYLKNRKKRENIILTPHYGEFNRLFKKSNLNKIQKTILAANLTNSTILFKGNDTVISTPKKETLISQESSPFLATAGSGDVLAGICGSFLAQGMKSHQAAAAASWLHNEIGLENGPGFIAEDMPRFIARTITKKLKKLYENGSKISKKK